MAPSSSAVPENVRLSCVCVGEKFIVANWVDGEREINRRRQEEGIMYLMTFGGVTFMDFSSCLDSASTT